jgi:hypothetical protein
MSCPFTVRTENNTQLFINNWVLFSVLTVKGHDIFTAYYLRHPSKYVFYENWNLFWNRKFLKKFTSISVCPNLKLRFPCRLLSNSIMSVLSGLNVISQSSLHFLMFERSELTMSCKFCRSLLICPRDVSSFNHISRHTYIHKLQSGFLPGYSTTHQLFENQTPLTLTFCDVSKAFDRVWIRALIYKLEKHDMSSSLKYFTNTTKKRYWSIVRSDRFVRFHKNCYNVSKFPKRRKTFLS